MEDTLLSNLKLVKDELRFDKARQSELVVGLAIKEIEKLSSQVNTLKKENLALNLLLTNTSN